MEVDIVKKLEETVEDMIGAWPMAIISLGPSALVRS
jgi:hypothetical protein